MKKVSQTNTVAAPNDIIRYEQTVVRPFGEPSYIKSFIKEKGSLPGSKNSTSKFHPIPDDYSEEYSPIFGKICKFLIPRGSEDPQHTRLQNPIRRDDDSDEACFFFFF